MQKTWMLKLRNVFLFGLNDRLEHECKKNKIANIEDDKFPPFLKKKTISGTSQKKDNYLYRGEFLINLKHHLNPNVPKLSGASL